MLRKLKRISLEIGGGGFAPDPLFPGKPHHVFVNGCHCETLSPRYAALRAGVPLAKGRSNLLLYLETATRSLY